MSASWSRWSCGPARSPARRRRPAGRRGRREGGHLPQLGGPRALLRGRAQARPDDPPARADRRARAAHACRRHGRPPGPAGPAHHACGDRPARLLGRPPRHQNPWRARARCPARPPARPSLAGHRLLLDLGRPRGRATRRSPAPGTPHARACPPRRPPRRASPTAPPWPSPARPARSNFPSRSPRCPTRFLAPAELNRRRRRLRHRARPSSLVPSARRQIA
ncbi:hypothetical protein LT493_35825 [Streptomyces tricolor]|nr:hypothetical protein [Streptomyces tricolor]